jgi:hypothetical protein
MRKTTFTLLMLSACLTSVASAATISQKLSQTASVDLKATPSGCENNPGPFITIDGEMRLSGLTARIILSNNEKGTHTTGADVTADVVIIPAGESIHIAKQPSRGGVGGNPWIYLQFKDGKGSDLGSPQLLGRCVQGLKNAKGAFSIPSGAACNVSTGNCVNSGGPDVTLNGEIRLGGLGAQLILTNNAKFTHATSADVVVDVVLLEEGKSITFAKQPPLDGAGGNPLIYVQFLSGSGSPLGSPILLGRCNKI